MTSARASAPVTPRQDGSARRATSRGRATSGAGRDPVALVIGGGSGIGRAAATCFAGNGMRVAVADLHVAAAEETVGLCGDDGPALLALSCDVADVDDLRAAAGATAEAFGRIDVLVVTAGHLDERPFETLEYASVIRMLAVHTAGPMFATQAVLPIMRSQGYGRVVCVASSAAMKGTADHHHYAAAKAGLLGFVRSVSRELARDGITINAVVPGAIDTPMLTSARGTEPKTSHIPVGRLGRPDEVAAAIEFLASPEAAYITGASLLITGGEYV